MQERVLAAVKSRQDDDDEPSGSKAMANSVTAIRSIKAGLKKKLAHTDGYLKYIEDSNKLISENAKKMESVYLSDLNPDKQAGIVETLEKGLNDIKDQTSQNMDLAIAKLRKAQEDLVDKIEEYLKLKRYDPFKETYKLNFEAIYDFEDSQQTVPKSDWEYTIDNTFPHMKAIHQPKVSSCRDSVEEPETECTATILSIKFKTFYDFRLTVDFKATSITGYVGIVFRKKDAFNYYSLDVGKEFIRFRKMIKGEQTIISTSKIDGVLSEKWYNIELVAKQNVFSAKIGLEKENVPSKYVNIPIILRGEDLYLKSGQNGLLTENTAGAMFDGFKIDHEDPSSRSPTPRS